METSAIAHGAKVSKAGQILELVKPCLCMQIIVYTMKISAIDIFKSCTHS